MPLCSAPRCRRTTSRPRDARKRWHGNCISRQSTSERRKVMSRTKAVAGSGALASLVLAAGCAGNQAVPASNMQLAEQRIDEAERADAQRYANRELNMAREKLLQAREAQEDGDEERAARLAEQAELDAAYALALAENESVQSAVNELRA